MPELLARALNVWDGWIGVGFGIPGGNLSENSNGVQPGRRVRTAVGPWSDLALHTIGWKAFQDLCSQVCEVVLERPVEIFREAQDGGQDAVFLISPSDDAEHVVGTVQCKHSSDPSK